jgi:hypothetical protein
VTTPLGRLPAVVDGLRPGPVTAMLRPEQVVPAAEGQGCRAAVVERRFRGDHTILDVEGPGFAFRLRARGPVEGDAVHLAVRGPCAVFRE